MADKTDAKPAPHHGIPAEQAKQVDHEEAVSKGTPNSDREQMETAAAKQKPR